MCRYDHSVNVCIVLINETKVKFDKHVKRSSMVDSSFVDKREERLKKRREADRRRREAETLEKCRARLDQQKAYRQNRKSSEADDERAARLVQNSRCQHQRLS